jgi:hypothetical protein
MTTETEPTPVRVRDLQITPLSAADSTFDPEETCARCGPSTRAQVKWVFPPISEFTHQHRDLYLCAHCSCVGERRLLATSILTVDSILGRIR